MKINVARTLARSSVNGPGERYVLWVQGCPLGCSGCWNPDTWSFERKQLREVQEVIADILGTPGIEGVTFSGGEPFVQARALAQVARAVRQKGLSVFIFTGYRLDELTSSHHRDLLGLTDVLVDGRYVESFREPGLIWRGSTNQRVHFLTDRYGPPNTLDVPEMEVFLDTNGAMTFTGFPRMRLELLEQNRS
jgi:anaerobic ribonucleoside-triphosphate reductase activating protein